MLQATPTRRTSPRKADRRAAAFVEAVRPHLESGDLRALERSLAGRFDDEAFLTRLARRRGDPTTRAVAAMALGVVGTRACEGALLELLRDGDALGRRVAEHAVWSVWCRAGGPTANRLLLLGSERLAEDDAAAALGCFDAAVRVAPRFAEALHQRGMTRLLLGEAQAARRDCEAATRAVPGHFCAWAGLGHCHAELGDAPSALMAYRRALDLNPQLDCVRSLVGELTRGGCRCRRALP